MKTRLVVALIFLLATTGCDRSETSSPTQPPGETVAADETAPTPTVEVTLDPAIPDDDVRELLDEWLSSQNDGDFDRYKTLYADRFEGIKRVGPRMYRFDHDGWLEDRQRMFKKKMKVSAEDVGIQASATSAIVTFQQTWASGSYKDTGPKQLVIARGAEANSLRIAREEMLASKVGDDDVSRPAYDPHAVALLADGAVVLDTAPKQSWAKGAPQSVNRGTSARRAVDLEASGFGAWIGKQVELYGPAGKVCEAKIVELELLAGVVPHFGTLDHWNGTLDKTTRKSDGYVAAAVWKLADDPAMGGGVDLVGRLDEPDKCEGAVWAKPRGAAARPLPAKELHGPALRDAMGSFTDLPGYHAQQADFDKFGHRGAWHEAPDALVDFTKFGAWVAGSSRAGHGCGSFEGSFWGLWRETGYGGLVLQSDDTNPGLWRFAPVAALEFQDNVYFAEPERIVARVGKRWDVVWEVAPPNHDCGC